MLAVELVHNAALLVALIVVYRLIVAHYDRSGSVFRKFSFQVFMGGLFGAACIVGMMTPVQWTPGIFIDGRTIILAVAGLFTGAIPALVTGAVAATYRLWIGGAGVWVGTATILQAVLLGLAYRALLARSNRRTGWLQYWAFGVVVHVVMLATFLWLPEGEGWSTLQKLGLPILVLYPLTTMLVCRVFQDYDERAANQNALEQSESRFRSFMDNTPVYAYIKGVDLRHVYANARVEELIRNLAPGRDGTRTGDFFHPDVTQQIEEADRAILSRAQTRVELEYAIEVNGSRRWLHDVNSPSRYPAGNLASGGWPMT